MRNEQIQLAIAEALESAVKNVISRIKAGEFDTMQWECSCGRKEHLKSSSYCVNCGQKIKWLDS